MPQFDTYAFFSQVFYFSLIFWVFYMIVLRDYLPNIGRLIKIREKILESSVDNNSYAEVTKQSKVNLILNNIPASFNNKISNGIETNFNNLIKEYYNNLTKFNSILK